MDCKHMDISNIFDEYILGELSEKEMEEFKRIGQPAYLDFIKEAVGQEWVDKAIRAADEAKKKMIDEEERIIQ